MHSKLGSLALTLALGTSLSAFGCKDDEGAKPATDASASSSSTDGGTTSTPTDGAAPVVRADGAAATAADGAVAPRPVDAATTTATDASAAAGTPVGTSNGAFVVYPQTAPATDNPAMTVAGSAEIWDLGTKTRFKLTLTGLKPDTQFGSHVHVAACDDMQAGGHYQHNLRPDAATAFDSEYANDANEVWLDFKSDAMGKASSDVTSNWKLVSSRAKAIIIHVMKTGDGGVGGAKLACVNLKYN